MPCCADRGGAVNRSIAPPVMAGARRRNADVAGVLGLAGPCVEQCFKSKRWKWLVHPFRLWLYVAQNNLHHLLLGNVGRDVRAPPMLFRPSTRNVAAIAWFPQAPTPNRWRSCMHRRCFL
jgi:hypothetical protein